MLKISSFNVNGIRAILKKDFVEDFKKLDSDIVVLQETKFFPKENEEFPFQPEGYHLFYTYSKVKKGYAGTAIFSKIKPLSVHYGLENNLYDDEGRVITLEFEKFYLVGCYVPNSGEELKRLDFRIVFETNLRKYLHDLDLKKPVIYTGDLNVAHNEIDIKNPKTNTHSAGFTKEERDEFTKLLDLGFVDTFRALYPNTVKYSWWSYRFKAREKGIGWRINYFVVSQRLFKDVKDSEILNDIYGSDHCPIRLSLDF